MASTPETVQQRVCVFIPMDVYLLSKQQAVALRQPFKQWLCEAMQHHLGATGMQLYRPVQKDVA